MRLYLDSSAIVKLVQTEAESEELTRFLRGRRTDRQVSSALARVEVVRAVQRGGAAAVASARRQLGRMTLFPMHRNLLDDAADLGNGGLRSLDAVHLASARRLGDELRAVVTYDLRMQAAAEALGLPTAAPR
ncbi:MAG: type II toxin-antitoxin system VapC family toxin [Geodermatophilaceae bacterium]|nr:type II toxin-antitoxin system VapC family toxin [Geodermatophilaceae bacterium]